MCRYIYSGKYARGSLHAHSIESWVTAQIDSLNVYLNVAEEENIRSLDNGFSTVNFRYIEVQCELYIFLFFLASRAKLNLSSYIKTLFDYVPVLEKETGKEKYFLKGNHQKYQLERID